MIISNNGTAAIVCAPGLISVQIGNFHPPAADQSHAQPLLPKMGRRLELI